MLEYCISFSNNAEIERNDIAELMAAAREEYRNGDNYVICVEVRDAGDSYPCWYQFLIYNRQLSPGQCFDRLFETILDRLDCEEAFLFAIDRAQAQLRKRR